MPISGQADKKLVELKLAKFGVVCTFLGGYELQQLQQLHWLQLQWTMNVDLIFACPSLKLSSFTQTPTPIATMSSLGHLQNLQLQ